MKCWSVLALLAILNDIVSWMYVMNLEAQDQIASSNMKGAIVPRSPMDKNHTGEKYYEIVS